MGAPTSSTQPWYDQSPPLKRRSQYCVTQSICTTGNLTAYEGVYLASMALGLAYGNITIRADEANGSLILTSGEGSSLYPAGPGQNFKATWLRENTFQVYDITRKQHQSFPLMSLSLML